MTFIVQGEVRVDGSDAKTEVAALRGEQDRLKSSARSMSAEGRKNAAEVRKMGQAAASAAGAVDTLADQERQAALAVANMGRSHALAAGQLGNLTAQFNDIGVMLAAGQNPLQLALQQGTQITQVIGPLGAAGAVRALGTAFVSLLSPVNLITIGSIAAGAAMFQWLTDAGEDAKSLEDRMDDLRAAVAEYTAAASLAEATTAELSEEFGTQAEAIRETLVLLREIALSKALDGLKVAVESIDISRLSYLVGIVQQGPGEFAASQNSQLFAQALEELQQELRVTGDEAVLLFSALSNLGAAAGPVEIVSAARDLNSLLLDVYGSVADIPPELRDMAQRLAEADVAASRIIGGMEGVAGATGGALAEAKKLTQEYWNAVSALNAAQGLGVPGGRGGDPRQFENDPYWKDKFFPDPEKPERKRTVGGGSYNAQAQALERLIAQERLQLEILRETDPVMKEMLRYREALAGATDAERREVEALIGVRVAEQQALSQAEAQRDAFKDATRSALRGLIHDGESLNDVLRNVAASLADAALQAALFDDGPFGGLFGGGLLGGLFGGRSASRAPSVAARPSAALAARGGSAPVAARGGPGTVNVSIDMRGGDGQNVEEVAYRGTVRALGEYDRRVLPSRVREINKYPHRDR